MGRLPTVVVRKDVLESWLTVSDYTRSRLAAELGVSKGRVSQLLTSEEEPSANLIARLMLLTNLPFERLFKIIHEHNRKIAAAASHASAADASLRRRAAKRAKKSAQPELANA